MTFMAENLSVPISAVSWKRVGNNNVVFSKLNSVRSSFHFQTRHLEDDNDFDRQSVMTHLSRWDSR
jgi:hypothetical protein